jgi:hypothetical protein
VADRYWVGGTAAWDSTAGTKWAATSGGAGGETVPTTSDDVYFDAASTGTCTISTGNTGAKSINCTGFTGGITGTIAITVAGSITLSALQTYTHSGIVTITGSGTLVTAGKTFSGVTVNGSGITVTLGDALNITTRTLTVTAGAFDTAGYSLTAGTLSSSNSNVRTINFNASTIVITPFNINFATSNNLSFNAGTSQINLVSSGAGLSGGSQTFYNVSFTSTATGTRTLSGSNIFNNLTFTTGTNGLALLSITGNQTVNGTLTCAGASITTRAFLLSSTIGTARTITAAVISSADYCDFRDITIAGAASPISPTDAGDCGRNSGITFPAAKTVYRVGTNTAWAGSSSWALTSGGTGSNANFPLVQDTVVIDDATTLTGSLSLNAGYNIGEFDCSARSTGITINHLTNLNFYGSYTLGSGVTVAGTGTQVFAGTGTQTFTSAGKTITFSIIIDKFSSSFDFGDAFVSSRSISFIQGTLDAKNYNITCEAVTSVSNQFRIVNMGSGLWTLTRTGTVWNFSNTPNLTFNKDTADILLSDTTTDARIFSGGTGILYNKLTIGGETGTSITTIGSGTFTELASTKTVAHTVRFDSNNAAFNTWSVTGTLGNLVTVDSSTAGTRRTIGITNSTEGLINYMSVKDIGVSTADRFYVNNSIDGGNNLNVYFTSTPITTSTGNMFFMFN